MADSPTLPTITPFLMFSGKAEEAMTLYVELFANSKVVDIEKYGANDDGAEGTVKVATFSRNNRPHNIKRCTRAENDLTTDLCMMTTEVHYE